MNTQSAAQSAAASATSAAASAAAAATTLENTVNVFGLPSEAAAQKYNIENDAGVKAALSASYVPKIGTRHVYVGDYMGAGISDTTALTNAVAASAGKVLHLEGRSFSLEDLIQIGANGVTLDAEGAVLNFADDGTAQGQILRVFGCEDFTMIGGRITQTAAARTGFNGMLSLDQASNALIDRVTIVGGSGVGIYTAQVEGLRLLSPKVRDTKADGIHLSRGTKDVQVVAATIVGVADDGIAIVSVTSEPGSGVPYAPCSRITISDPVVRNLVTLGSGVAFVGGRDNSLIGGVIEAPIAAGVRVTQDTGAGTDVPADVTLSGTRVRSAGSDGYTIGTSTRVSMAGCSSVGATSLGLALVGATNAHVVGGALTGGGDVGVYSDGTASGNNLIGVDLRGNATGASAGTGHTLTSCITA